MDVVKFKQRFERGFSYTQYFYKFGIMAGVLKFLNLSEMWIIPMIIGTFGIGYIDEIHGVWKLENSRATTELNPHLARNLKK